MRRICQGADCTAAEVTQDAAYMEQELDVQKAGALAETEEHFKEIIENTELLW